MQLRVARLCLDCEELFEGEVCPVCASEQAAYLSKWLPVEERRRWRRSAPEGATATERRMTAVRQFIRDLFGDGTPVKTPGPLRTRRSDHVPSLDFDSTPKGPESPRPSAAPRPLRENAR